MWKLWYMLCDIHYSIISDSNCFDVNRIQIHQINTLKHCERKPKLLFLYVNLYFLCHGEFAWNQRQDTLAGILSSGLDASLTAESVSNAKIASIFALGKTNFECFLHMCDVMSHNSFSTGFFSLRMSISWYDPCVGSIIYFGKLSEFERHISQAEEDGKEVNVFQFKWKLLADWLHFPNSK